MAQSTVTVKFTPREYRLLRIAVRIGVLAGLGKLSEITERVIDAVDSEFPSYTDNMMTLEDSL